MAISLAEIDTQIDLAWGALRVNEKSYTVRGRQVIFASLDELQRHINWLRDMRTTLQGDADAAAGSAVCPVIQYQESE